MAQKSKYVSLSDWEHRKFIDVPLDEGVVVKMRLPDIGVWLSRGRIPNPLRAMAEKIEYDDAVDFRQLTEEERQDFFDLQAFIIATHVAQPDVLEASEGDIEKAQEWVLENIPPGDRNVLWMRALHILDPETQEVLSSIAELAPFRDRGAGSEPSNGSGENTKVS